MYNFFMSLLACLLADFIFIFIWSLGLIHFTISEEVKDGTE